MRHQDHVNLIHNSIPKTPGIWADLGSGEGAFTLALADLLLRTVKNRTPFDNNVTERNPRSLSFESKIYSIDQNRPSLQAQEAEFKRLFPDFEISFHAADFTHLPVPLTLTLSPKGRGDVGGMDGILMANSLHFVKDKVPVLKELKKLLKSGGRIVFVEYNIDKGNQWVPYPFSFESLKNLAKESGFSEPILAGTVPSQFLNEMYCAWITF